MLFSPGYNTHAFLVDFLEYYGCRPPNARNCVYEGGFWDYLVGPLGEENELVKSEHKCIVQ